MFCSSPVLYDDLVCAQLESRFSQVALGNRQKASRKMTTLLLSGGRTKRWLWCRLQVKYSGRVP